MVKPPAAREGDHFGQLARPHLPRAPSGRILVEPEMGTVLVVIAQVFPEQAGQMRFVPDHDMIQEVAPKGSDDPLAIPVLPGGPESDLLRSDAQCFHEGTRGSKDGVPVEQKVGREVVVREGVAKLLAHPFRSGVGCDTHVPNHPPPVIQDHQNIELPEVPSRHHHEIHRRNQLAVVIEKGLPGLGPSGIARPSGHPTRHAALRHLNPQLQQLPMDAGRTPKRVLPGHLADHVAQAGFQARPSTLLARPDTPEQTEPGAVPSDHRCRFHQEAGLFPPPPGLAQPDPETPVPGGGLRPLRSALEHSQLLPESQVLQFQCLNSGREALPGRPHSDDEQADEPLHFDSMPWLERARPQGSAHGLPGVGRAVPDYGQ